MKIKTLGAVDYAFQILPSSLTGFDALDIVLVDTMLNDRVALTSCSTSKNPKKGVIFFYSAYLPLGKVDIAAHLGHEVIHNKKDFHSKEFIFFILNYEEVSAYITNIHIGLSDNNPSNYLINRFWKYFEGNDGFAERVDKEKLEGLVRLNSELALSTLMDFLYNEARKVVALEIKEKRTERINDNELTETFDIENLTRVKTLEMLDSELNKFNGGDNINNPRVMFPDAQYALASFIAMKAYDIIKAKVEEPKKREVFMNLLSFFETANTDLINEYSKKTIDRRFLSDIFYAAWETAFRSVFGSEPMCDVKEVFDISKLILEFKEKCKGLKN